MTIMTKSFMILKYLFDYLLFVGRCAIDLLKRCHNILYSVNKQNVNQRFTIICVLYIGNCKKCVSIVKQFEERRYRHG